MLKKMLTVLLTASLLSCFAISCSSGILGSIDDLKEKIGATTISVTGISLDESTLALTVDEELSLIPILEPANASNKAVTWNSDNTAAVTVVNGRLNAKAEGSATITVTTVDGGFSDICNVTVVSGPFAGDGTYGSPYLIRTAAKLKTLSSLVNDGISPHADAGKYYQLTTNLDLSSYGTGTGWVPIGLDSSKPFKGYFDGNNKTISNLRINNTSLDNAGLFGFISGGKVDNLGLLNVNITARAQVGALAASIDNSTINYCYITGTVNCYSHTVGGMAGEIKNSIVSYSYSRADVTSPSSYNTGGLVGLINHGNTVNNCYVIGNVSGEMCVGGLAGSLFYSTINNCYYAGEVKGGDMVAGLVGQLTGTDALHRVTIENCYATGKVTGVGSAGGLAGNIYNWGDILNSFAEGDVRGAWCGGIVGSIFETGYIYSCYAIGEVNGSSIGGGIAGYIEDANSSMASCYTTGAVSGKDYAGGIVGQVKDSTANNKVRNCVALNASVSYISTSSSTNFGRIAGSASVNALNNNYALDTMTLLGSIVSGAGNANDKDGASVSGGTAANQYNNQSWWESAPGFYFRGGAYVYDWRWNTDKNLPDINFTPIDF